MDECWCGKRLLVFMKGQCMLLKGTAEFCSVHTAAFFALLLPHSPCHIVYTPSLYTGKPKFKKESHCPKREGFLALTREKREACVSSSSSSSSFVSFWFLFLGCLELLGDWFPYMQRSLSVFVIWQADHTHQSSFICFCFFACVSFIHGMDIDYTRAPCTQLGNLEIICKTS